MLTNARSAAQGAVLLVEAEPLVRKLVSFVLTSSGYKVLSASGPAEATEILNRNPGVQLLLTDIDMPEGDGCELARKMRARYPELKVLFMLGYPPARPSALEGGKLLRKPFHLAELLSSVAETFA